MAYRERKLLQIILGLIVFVCITIGAVTILIYLIIANQWGTYQILTGVGAVIIIFGGLWLYSTFARATGISNKRLDARSSEMKMGDTEQVEKRRFIFQAISFTVLLIGIILLVIGLVGMF